MMIKKILVVICMTVSSAFAFDLKSKPIEVVIPFPPGGGVDLTYRHFEKYAASKGITTVPVYKPGADGLIAMRDLANGSKEGHRIGFSTSAVQSSVLLREPNLGIVPITAIKVGIAGFVVHSKSTIKNYDQFLTALKTNDKINVASAAPGQALFWSHFFDSANMPQKTLINYKGSQPLLNDLLGQHVDVAMLPMSIILPHIKNNNLRILAHTSNTKLKEFPNSTPLARTNQNMGKTFDMFIAVSPKLDKPAADAWNELLRQYVLDPEIQQQFIDDYSDPVFFGTGAVAESIANIRQAQNKIPKN